MELQAPDSKLTEEIIRFAIEVHRVIGPGRSRGVLGGRSEEMRGRFEVQSTPLENFKTSQTFF